MPLPLLIEPYVEEKFKEMARNVYINHNEFLIYIIMGKSRIKQNSV